MSTIDYIDLGLTIAALALIAGGCVTAGRGRNGVGFLLFAIACIAMAVGGGDIAARAQKTDFAGLIVRDVGILFEKGFVGEAILGSIFAVVLLVAALFLVVAILCFREEARENGWHSRSRMTDILRRP